MVNPNKHKNNINADDLKNIYDNLVLKYEKTRDFNIKKEINQEIIILILLSRGFPVSAINDIDYEFFDGEPSNSLLYKHLRLHLENNFCELDKPLLSNKQNKSYNIDDINKILSKINTNIEKDISIESLNISNSILNDFGKIKYDKRNVRKRVELNNQLKVMKDTIENYQDEKIEDSIKIDEMNNKLNELLSKLNQMILLHTPHDKNTNQVNLIIEKQEIIEDKLTHNYNQLENILRKIHENTKSVKYKNNVFDDNGTNNELFTLNKSMVLSLENQESKINNLELKIDNLMENINNKKLSSDSYSKDEKTLEEINIASKDNSKVFSSETSKIESNKKFIKKQQIIDNEEFDEFTRQWFNNNLIITYNKEDTISLEEIILRIKNDINSRKISLNQKYLFDNIEDYLKRWCNLNHNKKNRAYYGSKHEVKKIRSTYFDSTIRYKNGKKVFETIKFIDIKEKRENNIKNSIIEWIKENTAEENSSKIYTKEILDKIKPLFNKNGWIITNKKEWKALQELDFTKICDNVTFSQIIGKAMREVYPSLNSDTIQRDTPNDSGKLTWYPDIKLLDKKVSIELDSKINYELTDEIFDSNNIIYIWLKSNLEYTGQDTDLTYQSTLLEKIEDYLLNNNIKISSSTIETIFVNSLRNIHERHGISFKEEKNEIKRFKLILEKNESYIEIIENWINKNIIITKNIDDRVYDDEIVEKLHSILHQEKIYVIDDNYYEKIPSSLQENFISDSIFEKTKNNILQKLLKEVYKVEDSIEGTYYRSTKIIKYTVLKPEIVKKWVEENIENIFEKNVGFEKDIIKEFEDYLITKNIKNMASETAYTLLNSEIHNYYNKKEDITLRDAEDKTTKEHIYVLHE